MTVSARIMSMQIDAVSHTGRRSTWIGRFWWRLRNRSPLIYALWVSTWPEWVE